MKSAQHLLEDGFVVLIHPNGQVYVIHEGKALPLLINPRAIINATLDKCGVEDVEGFELEAMPLTKNKIPVEHDFMNNVPIL